jgi:hypothetical protein
MARHIPSEAVQISAQIFTVEMARHLVKDKGVDLAEAFKASVSSTRACLDATIFTTPNSEDSPSLEHGELK